MKPKDARDRGAAQIWEEFLTMPELKDRDRGKEIRGALGYEFDESGRAPSSNSSGWNSCRLDMGDEPGKGTRRESGKERGHRGKIKHLKSSTPSASRLVSPVISGKWVQWTTDTLIDTYRHPEGSAPLGRRQGGKRCADEGIDCLHHAQQA